MKSCKKEKGGERPPFQGFFNINSPKEEPIDASISQFSISSKAAERRAR